MSRNVAILLYHRVGERDGSFMDEYTVSPESFRSQMEWIRRHGWKPTALENILRDKVRFIPDRSVVITFDDGFASNRIHAWPVLENLGFPSATFLVADRLGSRNTWDGPGRDVYALLSVQDLAEADPRVMTFHSHSLSHPELPLIESAALRKELEESKRIVSQFKGSGSLFAYPFGAWNAEVMQAVREAGYSAACSCIEGLNSRHTDPFLLRRVEVREMDVGWRLWLKLKTGRDLLAVRAWSARLRSWLRRRIQALFGRPLS